MTQRMTRPKLTLQPIQPGEIGQATAMATVWNAACGADWMISPQFAASATRPPANGYQAGRLAVADGEPLGFVLASTRTAPPDGPAWGWLDGLAVTPAAQGQGIGRLLADWAEGWLAEQGCRTVQVGGGSRSLVTGLPTELESQPFFARRGYAKTPTEAEVWDMAANLAGYTPPADLPAIPGQVRPAHPGDAAALLDFVRRAFPDSWYPEVAEFLADGGRPSDFMLLWTERGVDGFCQLTFLDSRRPLNRFYPFRLPQPWGHLGPVGVSADRRGQGFGLALVDAGLRRLHNNGVNGCIIHGVSRPASLARFDFTPHRPYARLQKSL
ncbi:MAG: hypothetical protein KatS3mg050_2186 [Litorilinea sp.]|nr:MAG: hypothetical protein KatS3mg050_2186 [Litorilinea sp.]